MEQDKKKYLHVYAHAEEVGDAFLDMVLKESEKSAFDPKMHELAYLAVLVAVGLEQGIIMHTKEAKKLGATREEIKSAALVALPAVGFPAIMGLKTALDSYDKENII
mgnify:CR=1 FL=1